MKWYDKPLRAVALQCNYEQGRNLEMIAKWAGMGINLEYVKHLFETERMADFDPARHGELMAEYIRRSHAKGIRIVIYFNVHILTGDNIARKDEWAQKNAKGEFMMNYTTFYATCMRSSYRDYFFSMLDAVMEYYVDGIFLDGPTVLGNGCWCDTCRREFRERYGHDMAAGKNRELFDFNAQSLYLFLNEAYRRFKEKKPEGLFHNNLPATQFEASYYLFPQVLEYNDLIGTEGGFFFYGPPKDGYVWTSSVTCKCLEAIAPGKARLNCLASNQMPWSWYMHTAVETRLCIASTFANAAGIWYGLHGASYLLETPGGRAAAEFLHWFAEHEAYYVATQSAASVAVLYSVDTERAYQTTHSASDLYGKAGNRPQFTGNFTNAFHGVCDVLNRSSIPFDVVADLTLSQEQLARYACLFLPTCACLSDKTVALIREYVEKGGCLVALFESSLYTERGERRNDLGLADVLGASVTGNVTPLQNWNYFSPCGANPIFAGLDIPLYPAPAFALDVQPHSGARVLARFHKPMPGRYDPLTEQDKPAIILNRYGKGACLFLAGAFGEMCRVYNPVEYRTILANAVGQFAALPVRLEGQLGDVEVVVRKQGDRLLFHLVNYLGVPPRPYERICPQTGIRLRVRVDKRPSVVNALRAGAECEWFMEGDELIVRAPVLNDYEVVVIE